MSLFYSIFFTVVLLPGRWFLLLAHDSWCPHHFVQQTNRQFQQKTDRFWEYNEQTNSWVEVELPYDLISCLNDNCTKVGSLSRTTKKSEDHMQREYDPVERESLKKKDGQGGVEDSPDTVLPLRKRISLTKMSDESIWVTGESGSIYERFWNGVQWVIAPHDLPVFAGHAISVFIVNQTILALSEAGILYQLQLSESSQPVWLELIPRPNQKTGTEEEQSSAMLIKSGAVSHDGVRVYFCTRKGALIELSEVEPPRWVYHGRPPGANVAAIADASAIRIEVVYTISSIGDLYEYDRSSKPSWKKHIWREGTGQDASLIPSMGCTLHGLTGDHSISLFLLTKGGRLIERRLHQRKWKWVVHGSPKDEHLTAITPVLQEELNEKLFSLFLATSTGFIYEYRIPKQSGIAQENQIPDAWVSHMHPPYAKAARGIAGLQFHVGRMVFPLDDGRLAELHLPGLGGESTGPNQQVNVRRKASTKYIWSLIDAPESEGWNSEYCTEERGPTNCILGSKDELNGIGTLRSMTRRRKGSQEQAYIPPGASGGGRMISTEESSSQDNWITTNFRLRLMHGGRSFFLIADAGLTFEYLYTENVWLWLRHDHTTAIKGALGNYNGSLYVVDTYGSLLIRERSSNELTWINCTALTKGRQVTAGPPWDGMPGKAMRVTTEDALFFVSKTGRLLQFTVALRKFKWKDCRNPPNSKIATIVDQEMFRENVVFVLGRNGRLYQYNKVTELWHEHYQSQHLVLSKLPGTAMRPSLPSLTGSIFMLSEDGGLVEYHWNTLDGWNWVEHGTPYKGVTLVGSPGPCFDGNKLFSIGSDGKVYLRYMDEMTWKWKSCGFPYMGNTIVENQRQDKERETKEEICVDKDFAASLQMNSEPLHDLSENCDPKVASTRPIPFSEDSVIFELRDGRLNLVTLNSFGDAISLLLNIPRIELAELQRTESTDWFWSRTIGTPTSACIANYWTALAS